MTNRFGSFFEQRTNARPLAVARIIIGCASLLRALVSYHLFDRVLVPGVVRARLFEWLPDMSREMLPVYIVAWLLAAGAFTIGYRTRLSGSVLLTVLIYHLAVGQSFYWSHIYFLACLILLLIVANAGSDLAIDWRQSGGGSATVRRWCVTLLKLQVSIVYFVAAIAKLNGSFLSGEVLGRGLLRPDLSQVPEVLVLLAWGTIAFEGWMAFALWVKPLRLWAIVGGIIFHAMVPLTMGVVGGLIVFSTSIVGTYVLFLDRDEFATAESTCREIFQSFRKSLLRPARTTS